MRQREEEGEFMTKDAPQRAKKSKREQEREKRA
jgi:hypothetical protein